MSRRNDQANIIDLEIGRRIYSARIAKGLSRQQLSQDIGVTHQQLQKYEKGINRISVGRLFLISKFLDTDLAELCKNLEAKEDGFDKRSSVSGRICMEVSRNLMKLNSVQCQNAINVLIKSLINEKGVEEEHS